MNPRCIEDNRIKRCTGVRSAKGICTRLEAPFALLGPPCSVNFLIVVKSITVRVKIKSIHYTVTIVVERAIDKCPIHHKEGISIRVVYKLTISGVNNCMTILYTITIRIDIPRISRKETAHLAGIETRPRSGSTEQA